jgi:hypothetical protein
MRRMRRSLLLKLHDAYAPSTSTNDKFQYQRKSERHLDITTNSLHITNTTHAGAVNDELH